ncbi:hypothetical protein C8J57DRAFT_1247707 [Mycena rebaudengoi]|nr:hypothetical protein C8J57DRAFT_1247707 [Mycena rebaudengoi]
MVGGPIDVLTQSDGRKKDSEKLEAGRSLAYGRASNGGVPLRKKYGRCLGWIRESESALRGKLPRSGIARMVHAAFPRAAASSVEQLPTGAVTASQVAIGVLLDGDGRALALLRAAWDCINACVGRQAVAKHPHLSRSPMSVMECVAIHRDQGCAMSYARLASRRFKTPEKKG